LIEQDGEEKRLVVIGENFSLARIYFRAERFLVEE